MPELSFRVQGARTTPHAASPELTLELSIASQGAPIHSVLLECQLRIEVARRRYSDAEAAKLFELFGERQRWSSTQQSLLWARTTSLVPAFTDSTTLDLPLACSYDLMLGLGKYLHGLESGDLPLLLLFSGTVFYEGPEAKLQVSRIPWKEEARFALPLEIYRQTIDHYYPNQVPLTLERELFERLQRYKLEGECPTFDAAIARLLDRVGAGRPR